MLALSIGGIIGVLVQNVSAGKSIDYTYVATNLAKNEIERLREFRRDKGYMTLVEMAGETTETINRAGEQDSSGEFERTVTIDPDDIASLTTLTVKVKYKRGGVFLPVYTELVTMVSPYYE